HELENEESGNEPVVGVEVVAEIVVPGHFAAEVRVRFTHAALEEGVSDAVHHRGAVVSSDDVLYRVAGAEIINDPRTGMLQQEGLREKGGDEIARHELAGAVDEEAAVG